MEPAAPVSIPPPPRVRWAAFALLAQALAVLVLAVVLAAARSDLGLTSSLVTASYFVVLAALFVAVSFGLLRGRRWARTPAIVLELLVALTGFYLAVPSQQPLWGLVVLAVGAATLVLLLSRQSNDWIREFPPLFGPPEG